MKNGRRAHQCELLRADEVTSLFVEQTAHDDEVCFLEQRREFDLACAEVCQFDIVHKGIGGDEPEVEGACHPQQLFPDAPRADDA